MWQKQSGSQFCTTQLSAFLQFTESIQHTKVWSIIFKLMKQLPLIWFQCSIINFPAHMLIHCSSEYGKSNIGIILFYSHNDPINWSRLWQTHSHSLSLWVILWALWLSRISAKPLHPSTTLSIPSQWLSTNSFPIYIPG